MTCLQWLFPEQTACWKHQFAAMVAAPCRRPWRSVLQWAKGEQQAAAWHAGLLHDWNQPHNGETNSRRPRGLLTIPHSRHSDGCPVDGVVEHQRLLTLAGGLQGNKPATAKSMDQMKWAKLL